MPIKRRISYTCSPIDGLIMRRRFMNADQVSGASIPFDINDYLTVEALEDDLTITVLGVAGSRYRYGIDGVGWVQANIDLPIVLKKGQTVSFSSGANVINRFAFDKKCNLLGNCLSILFGDEAKGKTDISLFQGCFRELFYDCSTIVSVSANFLPATILSIGCYSGMFYGCTSLVNAPELPALNLKNDCYRELFYRCHSLNYIKMLATDISAIGCLYSWAVGVASTGTFIKNKNATWNVSGSDGVPRGWTIQKV